MIVNLSQFSSLFEIGFALHFAVAFLDRIYARELPIRFDRINARIKSLERFKREIRDGERMRAETGKDTELQLAYRTIKNPIWVKHNEQVLDRLIALGQDTKGQMQALKRILNVIMFLSVLVVLYSVSILFLMGLDMDFLKELDAMHASAIVLTQLLPLPIAAGIFFFVGRRMGHDVDRKIRGVGELNLMLNKIESSLLLQKISVEQVYRRDLNSHGYIEKSI